MRQLTVHSPVNLTGGNFTMILRGEKPEEAAPDAEFKLVDRRGQDLINAEVVDVWEGPLYHVPAILLEMAQDPLCRTFSGVQTQLAIYRENEEVATTPDIAVTVLIMRQKTSSILRATPSIMDRINKGRPQ